MLFKYNKGVEPRCLTKPVKLAACACAGNASLSSNNSWELWTFPL